MKIRVRVFGDLIPILGHELTVELEKGANINDLIQKISGRVEGFREKIEALSKRREITDSALVILLNGCNIKLLDGIETLLKDDDVVTFLPPAAGEVRCHSLPAFHDSHGYNISIGSRIAFNAS
ncbi:MoaD/ThiS family protein [Candidatus Bathyarchaeota archaeon]|nr:MoaD/ThiS family protein [Candidatus Bathyarchaeota archaeon]